MPHTAPPTTRWIREKQHGDEFIEHYRGVPWYDAPKPPPHHHCRPHTRGLVRAGNLPLVLVSRCACGATELNADGYWHDINSRSG